MSTADSKAHNIAIIGASGGIGQALTRQYQQRDNTTVYRLSRTKLQDQANSPAIVIDINDSDSIASAAEAITEPLDAIIIASGLLHNAEQQPEKSLRDIKPHALQQAFTTNAIGPLLVAKYFVPKMHAHRRAVFAALSARVGSISDNRLGGWYAYRASKAALNMYLKTLAIETKRRHQQRIVIGLHPGTVDTALSAPFQRNVPSEKLFTPEKSAEHLIHIIDSVTTNDSGKLFAWDGKVIDF